MLIMDVLHEWKPIAQRVGAHEQLRVQGRIFGNVRFLPGGWVTTSPIVDFREESGRRIINTQNGARYLLGKAAQDQATAAFALLRILRERSRYRRLGAWIVRHIAVVVPILGLVVLFLMFVSGNDQAGRTGDWTPFSSSTHVRWQSDAGTQVQHPPAERNGLVQACATVLWSIIAVMCLYTLRHFVFTMVRLLGAQRHPYIDVEAANWPPVTVFIAAHNEEAVIADSLQALLEIDYPRERLQIVPVNDRSTDTTREIIDDFVARFPGRIEPFHRTSGKPGKSAALKDATLRASGEILIVFDADYVPGKGLLKQLVAPFFDPETGAVMGRVVPLNAGTNLLTRLLDMERSGGYQVDQQARMNLRLVPQYGGTVGGVRVAALRSVGGWNDEALAEDTDLTVRLLLNGWKTVYQNRSECYEEVPESWPVRVRQISRWAKGHNQAALLYGWSLLTSRLINARERVDGLMLLGVYAIAPVLMLGLILALYLFYAGATGSLWFMGGGMAACSMVAYGTLGNFAAFYEIAAAVNLDRSQQRVRLLPLNYFGFLISLVAINRATLQQIVDALLGRKLVWHKTVRFRTAKASVS